MKTIKQLAEAIPAYLEPTVIGDENTLLQSLAYDSRQVFSGAGFVCLKGEKTDGHGYRDQAAARGGAAFIIDSNRVSDFAGVNAPLLTVTNTRSALPFFSAAFYDYPTRSFELTGITGTNGKTTTAFMISAIWMANGETTGVVGTVGALVNGEEFPTNWTVSTTPESLDLQQFFSQMRSEAVEHAIIEFTSIAIDQERTASNEFDTAVFTNLTQDHLDYHGTMEAYEAAKARLFVEYPSTTTKRFLAVLNADDPAGERLAMTSEHLGRRTVRYGIAVPSADFRAVNITAKADGTAFTVKELSGAVYQVDLPIGGLFNVSNALAAIAATRSRGVSIETVQHGLAKLPPVPGRFEPVNAPGKDFHVLVDYAHTPDGLENVLVSARALAPKRLVVVFGCGGNRDRTKRPKMGKIAADLADLVIITSDNPRNEDPEFIVSEIVAGIEGGAADDRIKVIVDRREAIRTAVCETVRPGDLIVIAGKGHETYQIVKGETFPFDDRVVAAEAIASCS